MRIIGRPLSPSQAGARGCVCAGAALLGLIAWLAVGAAPALSATGPRALEAPQVETSGLPEVGESLFCYPGTWEGAGITFTYEWQRDDSPLSAGQTYQTTTADEGHSLSCVVKAQDSEGTTEASSVDSFYIRPASTGPPPGGRLSGHVTDASTGKDIAGVKACAQNTNEAGPWVCVHTAANGRYALATEEAGNYVVEFFAAPRSGYIAHVYYGGKYQKSEATVLPVAAGSTTPEIDLQLAQGGQIAGTVTSAATGAPVQEVEVCARETGSECALTNARGEYTISELATGSYIVEFGFGYGGSLGEAYVAPEYYKELVFPRFPDLSEATPVSVTAGATATGIDAQMHEWAKLSGRVTSASTQAAIAGVEVDAYNGSSTSAYTNANGEYTISHLGSRTGEYTVSFSPGSELNYFPQWFSDKESQLAADAVHVPLDHTTTGIDAELVEAGQITGRVTDAATQAPLKGITVCAHSKIVFEGRCAWTDTNGEYAIVQLPTDEYEVQFYSNEDDYYPQYYDQSSEQYEGEKISVAVGHNTSGIDAAMTKVARGAITGWVHEYEGGSSIGGIEVCAYDLASEELRTEGLFAQCATTNAHGNYWIDGLSGGEYSVEFYASPASGLDYARQYYWNRSFGEHTVRVTEGKYSAGIDGALEQAGRLAGKVISAATKQPLTGIQACAYNGVEALVECVPTDANGRYETLPVPSGDYKVEFVSPANSGLNYVAQYFGGAFERNNAAEVKVQAGATTNEVDAELSAGGRITGRVTDAATSAPIVGIQACAEDGSYYEHLSCATTNANGQYAIAGLRLREYKVAFRGGGAYAWQYYNDKQRSEEAEQVVVEAGMTTAGIDAAVHAEAAPSKPVITEQPISASVDAGEAVSFSASALAKPMAAVQWEVSPDGRLDYRPIPGATSTTFTIASTSTPQSGARYRAVFRNAEGAIPTEPAELKVNAPASSPVIVEQPASVTVGPGQSASFSASATGNPTPTVQWERSTNGGLTYQRIAGATSTTLTIAKVASSESGNRFRALFSNSKGTALTGSARLTIKTDAEELPELGRCMAAAAKRRGKFAGPNCLVYSVPKQRGRYEWKAGPGPKQQFSGASGEVTLETIAKLRIRCQRESYRGAYTSPQTATASITLSGCKLVAGGKRGPCQNRGPEEIETNLLEGSIGYVATGAHVVGLELRPSVLSPPAVATFVCRELQVAIGGSLVGEVSGIDGMVMSLGLKFQAVGGKQTPESIEGAIAEPLTVAYSGRPAQQAGFTAEMSVTNEESLEVKATA